MTKVSAGSFLSDFSPKGVVAFFASTAKQESPNPQTVLAPCVGGEKTWDGEGATNNWSEAANWTCDQVPAVTDNVKFDATSTKDAIVNVPTVALELQVAATYSGTISIANGVSLLIGRSAGNGRQTATQAGGNIICGSGSTLTVSRTNFTQTGGTLDCSAGAVTTSFATITMNGGIFNAPSGTLTLSGSTLSIGASGTFNHNGGTIVSRDDNALLGIPQPLVINNLISESQTSQNLTDSTVRILGDLTLNSGGVITGAQRTNWELHGNITVANGAPTVSRLNTFITIAGTNDQTFINSGGLNPTATWRINKPGG
ncbi:MAG TPA: hypothetical protein PKY59_19450, partial [Pyrinomonadaceae bacterium]|nr:hypothetical protein [Pyrinomonadaceae bacterium]